MPKAVLPLGGATVVRDASRVRVAPWAASHEPLALAP